MLKQINELLKFTMTNIMDEYTSIPKEQVQNL